MDDIAERLPGLLGQVADRCWDERDLDDFLGWRGATLEYWVQMVFAAVAGRTIWAARGETPLITACPNVTAKTGQKWADGAVIWPDGAGAVAEIKAVPVSRPTAVRAVASDLASLVAVDWPATLQWAGPDRGVDERWWQDRYRITELWSVSIALVHGVQPMADPVNWVQHQLAAALAGLRRRFPATPRWITPAELALARPMFVSRWSGKRHAAVLLAWAAPPL